MEQTLKNDVGALLLYEGPGCLLANQLFKASLKVVFQRPLGAGAVVALATRHVSDFGDPQMEQPLEENYVSLAMSGGDAVWRLGKLNNGQRHPWNRGIELCLESGHVPAGAVLTVSLGGLSPDSPGYRAQSFAEAGFRFRLGLDVAGSGSWATLPLDACPAVDVTGNRAAGLRAVVNRVTDGRSRDVFLKPEDAYGNLASGPFDDLVLLLDDNVRLEKIRFQGAAPKTVSVNLPDDGKVHTVSAVSDDGAFFARSNPFGPSPVHGLNLYFGDLHVMSGHCCGTGNAAAQYEYARNVAGLDFSTVTSLDLQMSEKDWEEIQQATRLADDPGKFVAFHAYEWGGATARGGDHCVFFPDDDAVFVNNGVQSAPVWSDAADAKGPIRDIAETIAELKSRRVMLIPHCGGRRCNLDFFDMSVMPMLEIHSTHRTFGDAAFDAVRRGIRCGFVGGSDDHRGAPGDSIPTARERFFSSRGGLAGVYAGELTRESLWEAFFQRRVYATSGMRAIMAVDIEDTPMGGEIQAPEGTLMKLSFRVVPEGFLDRVEIMKGDTLCHVFYGKERQVREFAGEYEIKVESSACAYHVRMFQTDGGWAWSSPIWVSPV